MVTAKPWVTASPRRTRRLQKCDPRPTGQYGVEISGAYETNRSIFLIVGKSWEAWALWSMVRHLEFIGTPDNSHSRL